MTANPVAALKDVIARHWGYHSFRPLQEPAMRAVLDGRDSLVVMPTGGGKSLCYQAPAVIRNDTTVVVSPLIALMHDQVGGLRANGVAAAQLNSSLGPEESADTVSALRRGDLRLLFVSPERLAMPGFQRLLQQIDVRSVAIDEAHCISHWGHDFRPEYRQLAVLRELLPNASFHGYTATATERVRSDIIAQLGLREPEVLVGDFDRPNLTYRVLPRTDLMRQVAEVLKRHDKEAGIIYCLRRRDVDDLAGDLRRAGRKVMPYHAGLTPDERRAAQDDFLSERCDLIVATVAFGMGIDRSNLRFVLHAAMPKSIEHYQQEAGRAGRDGLPAECVLLYAAGDFMTMKRIIEKSAEEAGAGAEFVAGALRHLEAMNSYCRGAACRHRTLVEHFGQPFRPGPCQACDVCLGEVHAEPASMVIAQKVLSCVARLKEGYGVGHVAAVLHGDANEAVRRRGHDKLSTHGLLKEESAAQIRDWVYQLVAQGLLIQTDDEYPVLKLSAAAWDVMRGTRNVQLMRQAKRGRKTRERVQAAVEAESWAGVDRELFEELRGLRRMLALERQVPPYLIFGDVTLRELSRSKPTTRAAMLHVYGIGEAKMRDFGDRFLEKIVAYVGK